MFLFRASIHSTCGRKGPCSGRGLVQRSVVEVRVWHVVLLWLKVHHWQHGIHLSRQWILYHHPIDPNP